MTHDLKLIFVRLQRRRRGEDVPVISRRQYWRLRGWCKGHLDVLSYLIMLAVLMMADTRLWFFLFSGAFGAVAILWRWYRRDVGRDDTENEEATNGKV